MYPPDVDNDIADLNTAYLLLAQTLLRRDRGGAMLTLGYTPDVADFVAGLSPAQIRRMASTNVLLCNFRAGAAMPSIFDNSRDQWLQRAHLFIVLAAQHGPSPQQAKEEIPA
ncbi:MAG TPA: flagellar transcriptional regulator FlhD [Ramlibacter sp.]|nr:flagellar transcriptional regulator FlhD [Ramlibacter sp.]